MRVEAIVLDVGGVLLLPDPGVLGPALDEAGVDHRPDALGMAHFGGVAALDATPGDWPADGAPGAYLDGLVAAAGVPAEQAQAAVAALRPRFGGPAIEIWRHEAPWARDGIRALEADGRPVAVVSNADGSAEAQLTLHGLAQVGDGPGLSVAAIVDSTVVGVAKPAPGIFDTAIEALDVAPERCLYVGDTVTFDVAGARAADLRPLHLDPTGYCTADDHPHAADLASALRAG